MAGRTRKQLGAWYTPPDLVDLVVDAVVDEEFVQRRLATARCFRVLDPACGDGRFLRAVAERLAEIVPTDRLELVGIDIDPDAAAITSAALPDAEVVCGDALDHRWCGAAFDLVIGNPPFLSQLATGTTRGGTSRHGGGPYADAAVEFLALSARLVDGDGGRIALVLPQSVLSTRDAGPVRAAIDHRASMRWSWWTGEQLFDAQVHTCAVAFDFHPPVEGTTDGRDEPTTWSHVIAERTGVPELPPAPVTLGTLGDRARLNANFRDEYYGMVPAVGDHLAGPALITSGLIDPGCSWWGVRPITFARTRYDRPRLDLDRLDDKMRRWADGRLVPKVLVANQTRIIEAVCDPDGDWLPAVPVIAVYPHDRVARSTSSWDIAAVLTSPYASAWVWHRSAGTGMSADTVRLGPVLLGDLPWPAGDLTAAVAALRAGDVRSCGRAVLEAAGIDDPWRDPLTEWWETALARIEARQPGTVVS